MGTTESTSPRSGDLLLVPDPRVADAYTISVSPGLPQVRYPSYEAAIDAAARWVARTGAAVWVATDGRTFRRLALTGPAYGELLRQGSDRQVP